MARNVSVPTEDMKGFTLLEVLVSMAILVIIMAALYSAYTTNVEAIQIARQNGEVHQTARIVLDRMTKDLQSALIEVSVPSDKLKLGLVGEDREIDGRLHQRHCGVQNRRMANCKMSRLGDQFSFVSLQFAIPDP